MADDRFTKIFFGVSTSLIAAGVIGVWSMSTTLSRLDERVANWTKTVSERLDYATTRIDQITKDQRDAQRDNDRRLGQLEGRSRSN
jgi:hypothetical protein